MDRIADADRDRVIEELRAHYAAGRLDAEMLNQRVETALATDDPYTLESLLGDLPGAGYAWSPSQATGQQVVPYQPVQTGPYPSPAVPQNYQATGWQQRLGGSQGLFIALGAILLITILAGSNGLSTWWLFFFIFFWLPGMRQGARRRQMLRAQQPPQAFPPYNPSPPPVQDSFRPEEGMGGQPNQWPTRPQ